MKLKNFNMYFLKVLIMCVESDFKGYKLDRPCI